MNALSLRRKSILDFIRDFIEERGYPPTVRDIQNGCHISSTSVVDYHLRALEREGHLRRDLRVSRGLELLGVAGRMNTVAVPLIGYIAAGEPMPVPQPDAWDMVSGADVLEVPAELLGGRSEVYALRVKGDSMIDALIGDGDVVLMQQVNQAEDGDMVAVWLKGERSVTLKRLYREAGRVRLEPANSTMAPIYAAPGDVEVQGRVVGVVRSY